MVLRLGAILLMASLPLSGLLRVENEALLDEGGSASMLGTEVRLEAIEAELPQNYLQVGENTDFRLEGVQARLALQSGEVMAGSGMPAKAGGVYYRLTHLGYALPIKGQGLDGVHHLDVLPPGKTHKPGKRDLSIRLEPVKTMKKGLLTGRAYDLASPSFGILKGKGGSERIYTPKPGRSSEEGEFEIGEPGLYLRIQAVRGSALMLLRPLWYERRFMAVEKNGRLLIGYSEEFLKKWGVYKFRNWTEGFIKQAEGEET
jgi:hypothetical protein